MRSARSGGSSCTAFVLPTPTEHQPEQAHVLAQRGDLGHELLVALLGPCDAIPHGFDPVLSDHRNGPPARLAEHGSPRG